MRRSPIALLALLLTLLLAACGGAPAAQSPTSPPAPTAAPTPEAATAAATDATAAATEASGAPTTAPATAGETTLNVFAAASLTDAFKALAPAFEAAYPGVKLVFNFAGSQQLATQLGEGAPADVFASANKKQMEVAITSTRVVSGTDHTFVRNKLVVITPKENPAGITSLKDLAKPGVKLVFEAKDVPAGQYTLDVLAKASALPEYTESFSPTVFANVVSYEDNVRSVLTKIALGEGDAGVVYTTDSATQADQLAEIAIPDELNVIAAYPIAPVADSAAPELAQAFVDFVLSPEAQQVLVQYGFIPVTGDASGAAPTAKPVEVSGLVSNPRSFSAEDLIAYAPLTVTVQDHGQDLTLSGAPLAAVLEEIGLKPEAKSLVFVGGDGYTAELTLADVAADKEAIIAIDANGALRNVLPSQKPGKWVKGLVAIEVK